MSSSGVRKGAWTTEEDVLLKNCINVYGERQWHLIPLRAGLNRCRKSCRLRWLNYLSPNIKKGEFSEDEIDLIIRLHNLLGNRWSLIAGRLPGRTANDVKNYWNTHFSKKKTVKPQTPPRNPIVKPKPWTIPKGFPGVKLKAAEDVKSVEAGEESMSETSLQRDDCIAFWESMITNEGSSSSSISGCRQNVAHTDSTKDLPDSSCFRIDDLWDFLNAEDNNFI